MLDALPNQIMAGPYYAFTSEFCYGNQRVKAAALGYQAATWMEIIVLATCFRIVNEC